MTAPLTIVDARLGGAAVGLRAVDGSITAVGPDVAPEPDDEVVEAHGMALAPGLVNGHTHAAMTLFRSFGDDMPLMEWLRDKIWPAEANLTPDDVYWGTRLACTEMIRSGTTRFFDMYWHGPQVARAAADAGIRACVSAVMFDNHDAAAAAEMRSGATDALDAITEVASQTSTRGLVTPCLGPHAIYTVSDESLRWTAELASEREVPVQIHLAETEDEVNDCIAAHGVPPAIHLDRLGLLTDHTVLSHCNWLSDDELELVAARGATIVSCPCSNMKLANGRAFPYPQAASASVRLGLGTDGAASNNNLDMYEEMKVFSLVQKHTCVDASVAAASEVLAIAVGARSPLLRGDEHTEPLSVGAPADFVLVRTDLVEMTPHRSEGFDANLVYSANGHVVDTTVVAGRVLMRGRQVDDEHEVRAEVTARSQRLCMT